MVLMIILLIIDHYSFPRFLLSKNFRVLHSIYRDHISEVLNQLLKGLDRKGTKRIGGFCLDEMEIKAGLEYIQEYHQLFGIAISDPIWENQIISKLFDNNRLNIKFIEENLANKVLAIFFSTSDGSVSIPIQMIPTKKLTGNFSFPLLIN